MPYYSDFAVITSKLFSSEVFFAKSHFTEIWVESGLRAIKGCSNKLGIKEKISRGKFPRLIFSCPVPSGLLHRSHCVSMNMNRSRTGFFAR